MKETLEKVKASISAALLGKTPAQLADEQRKAAVKTAVDDFLSKYPADYFSSALDGSLTPVKTGKRIKEKGIALCHESQGYSANLRPVSLLMKSGISLRINKSALENATPEVLAALKCLGYDVNQEA